jgi:hypothetical protein
MQRLIKNFLSGCNTTPLTNNGNGNGNGNGTILTSKNKMDVMCRKLPNANPEDLRKYCIHSSMSNSLLQSLTGEWVGFKSEGNSPFLLFCTLDLKVIIILQWCEKRALCIPKRVEITDDDMVDYTPVSDNIPELSNDIILFPCENKSFILFSPKLKKCVFFDSNFEVEKQDKTLILAGKENDFSTHVIEIKHRSGFDYIFAYVCKKNVHQKQGDEEQNPLSAEQFVEEIIKVYHSEKSQ